MAKIIVLDNATQTIKSIIVAAVTDAPPDGCSLLEYVDGVNIGWQLQDGVFVDPIPPEPAHPTPNWLNFKAAFLGEPSWLAIAPLFSNSDIRIGIVAAVGTSNAADFQGNYSLAIADLTAQNIPLDPAVLAQWQAIADANNIPITF